MKKILLLATCGLMACVLSTNAAITTVDADMASSSSLSMNMALTWIDVHPIEPALAEGNVGEIVPEPATYAWSTALMLLGFAGVSTYRKSRKNIAG
jgi:hypothetical protein